jgi:hypothetical protein
MKKRNDEVKDDLFLKVSINNIQNGFIKEIGLREFAVLTAIASFSNDKGECFPSQEKLAEICGVSVRTIIRLIDNLCKVQIEGKPVLVRETKRKSEKVTKNEYTVLPSAGMAFGANKVVSNLSQRNAEAGHCEDFSEGSDKIGKKVVTKLAKGTDKNVTLTKSINEIQLTKSNIEQDNKNGSYIVEDKKESLNNNNKINIIKDKDSNNLTDNLGDNIGDISYSFVAENKSVISENKSGKGSTAWGEVSGSTADKKSESLSLERILREREGASRQANERQRAAYVEEQRRIESTYYGNKNAAKTAENGSKGKRLSMRKKQPILQNNAFDELSFEELLAMSDEEIQALKA